MKLRATQVSRIVLLVVGVTHKVVVQIVLQVLTALVRVVTMFV